MVQVLLQWSFWCCLPGQPREGDMLGQEDESKLQVQWGSWCPQLESAMGYRVRNLLNAKSRSLVSNRVLQGELDLTHGIVARSPALGSSNFLWMREALTTQYLGLKQVKVSISLSDLFTQMHVPYSICLVCTCRLMGPQCRGKSLKHPAAWLGNCTEWNRILTKMTSLLHTALACWIYHNCLVGAFKWPVQQVSMYMLTGTAVHSNKAAILLSLEEEYHFAQLQFSENMRF